MATTNSAPARASRRGWIRGARRIVSPNFGPRPQGLAIDLIVVHSISLPPGTYGGDEIAQFFTNLLDCDAHPYFDRLRGVEVSSHFVIRRDGELLQFVSCEDRAWHAGRSSWKGRENCNDYSIGIELEGLEGESFESVQYDALAALVKTLARRYPIHDIAGHEQVAPGRKNDPGAGFDWRLLKALLGPRSEICQAGSIRYR